MGNGKLSEIRALAADFFARYSKMHASGKFDESGIGITESEFDSWRYKVEAYLSDLKLPPELLEEWDTVQDLSTFLFWPDRSGHSAAKLSHPLEAYEQRLRACMKFIRKTEPYGRLRREKETSGSFSPPKVRILFLAANPLTTGRLDLEDELRSLEIELRGVQFRDEISLTAGHAVRPDDLVRLLRRERPTVVHFSGHGSPEGIALRSDKGPEAVSVSGQELARLFGDRGVALVVLNACFSESQASFLSEVVKAVVGTTDAVGDEAARRFSVAFYRTLGDGHPLKDAFRDGGDAVALHALQDVYHAYGNLDEPLCG